MNVNERRITKWNAVPFVNYDGSLPINLDRRCRFTEQKYNFLLSYRAHMVFHGAITVQSPVWSSCYIASPKVTVLNSLFSAEFKKLPQVHYAKCKSRSSLKFDDCEMLNGITIWFPFESV